MLLPCSSCRRHVRSEERQCPFCAAELDFSRVPEPRLPGRRLGRAATFAFGATVVSATALASCGGREETGEGESGGGAGMSADAGNVAGTDFGGATAVPVYGAPADPDAGVGGGSAGNSSGGANTAGTSSNGGSGGMVSDDGGVQPLYGAVPAAGAGNDGDAGLPGPVYGAPP